LRKRSLCRSLALNLLTTGHLHAPHSHSLAAVSALALFARRLALQEAQAPPAPVTPSPATVGTPAPPVSYACESGQSVTVAYPDTATALLTYKARATHCAPSVGFWCPLRRIGSGMVERHP
jgi:hypothetical protein